MANEKVYTEIEGNGFRILLFFLLLYIVGSPFLIPYPSLASLAHALLSMSLFFAIYTVQKKQPQRPIVIFMIMPVIVLYWLGIYDIVDFTLRGAYLLFVIYYGLLIYSYILQIFHSKKITANVLFASFCLYLMIGLFWGAAFGLLDQLSPGAYSGALLDDANTGTIHIFNYLSMITLTTLGYGDITPQTPGAAALCQVEAIIGQFFTAVLVAWLVAQYIIDMQDKKEETVSNLSKEK